MFLLPILLLFAGCATVEEFVREEVDERVQENVDEGVEKTADETEGGIENAVKCAIGDSECIEEAQEEGETVVLTDEDGNVKRDENGDPVTASDREQEQTTADASEQPESPEKQGREPGEANPNYDFEPGKRTIFAEDFSDDTVGNFPRSLEFRQGSMEIVEMQGQRFLRVNEDGSVFRVQLPERYTIEFDYHAGHWVDNTYISPLDESGETVGENYFHGGGDELGVRGRGDNAVTSIKESRRASKQIVPIRIMVDGSYVKAYMGQERFANIPNADILRTSTLRFDFDRLREPGYIGNLRIAAGGRDLYNALQGEGRVTYSSTPERQPSSPPPMKP